MNTKTIFVVVFSAICFSRAFAQDRAPNTPAEGPFRDPSAPNVVSPTPFRQNKQFGVNRRVAVGRPEDARNLGFTGISGQFSNIKLQVPTGSGINNQLAGQLPNKPTFYFGIRGPGRYWPQGAIPSWTSSDSVEVDAGLEYDSRSVYRGINVRGWRAFISINGVQTNYYLNNDRNSPWRGESNQYYLNFSIDRNGVPHLRVDGSDANFEFDWRHDGNVNGAGETVYPRTSDQLIGLKKVIADTRPDPGTGVEADNYALDGLRFTCTSDDVRIYYRWDSAFGEITDNQFLDVRYPEGNSTPAFFGIDGITTGHDTPLQGRDSYDWPDAAGNPTVRSRRIVDFPNLDGATSLVVSGRRYPELIDTGRNRGSHNATQETRSRYRRETVRINLYIARRATGKVGFIRRGGTP